MKQKFLICKHCGNIVAMIRDQGVPVYCCGEKMRELIPGATEGSGEKHIPVYQVEGNIVHVTVGAAEHPMTPEVLRSQVPQERLYDRTSSGSSVSAVYRKRHR